MEKVIVKNSANTVTLGTIYTHTHTGILNNNKRAGVNTALKVMDKKENQD